MIRAANRRTRPGFTLVELMVAAAVCVLIMAVLATAFQMGIDTMRQMKSTGDMMDQLRGATTALQADLKAKHLLNKDGQEFKLSDLRWDRCFVEDDTSKNLGDPGKFRIKMKDDSGASIPWKAPDNGFFRIRSTPITGQQADADGLVNGTGIARDHYLHFTSILSGNSDDDYYRATITVNGQTRTYHSVAAEIAYFLEQAPTGTTGGPGTPTLHRLIRRQRLAALGDTDRRDRPWPPAPTSTSPPAQADERHALFSLRQDIDSKGNLLFYLNTLGELTSPFNRLGGTRWLNSSSTPSSATPAQHGPAYSPLNTGPLDDALAPMMSRPGEDTVLSNVLSFEVQVLYAFPTDGRLPIATDVQGKVVNPYPRPFVAGSSTDTPFDTLPPAPTATATQTTPPTLSPAPPSPSQSTGNNIGGLAGTSTYDSWNQGMNKWTTDVDPNSGVVTPGPTVPPLLIRVQAVQVRIRVWDPKLQNARQVTIVQDL